MSISITDKPEMNVLNMGDEISGDQLAAIQSATNPTAINPFATLADVGGGGGGGGSSLSKNDGNTTTTLTLQTVGQDNNDGFLLTNTSDNLSVQFGTGGGVNSTYIILAGGINQYDLSTQIGLGYAYFNGQYGTVYINNGDGLDAGLHCSSDYITYARYTSGGIQFADGSFQGTAGYSGQMNVIVDSGSWNVSDYIILPNDYAVANDGGNIGLSGWTAGQSAIVVCGNGATNDVVIGGLGTIYDYGTFPTLNTLSAGMVAKIVCIATDEYHLIQIA